MKKILAMVALIFLEGCSSLDTAVTSINKTFTSLNNYSVNFILSDYEIDQRIPAFRPGSIYFAQYSPEISETFHRELAYFAKNFKMYHNSRNKILINGFIDLDEKNRDFTTLGKKRANEVKESLINLGILEEYILTNDLGGKKYFNSNKNAVEKARNRCVTIEIYRQKINR